MLATELHQKYPNGTIIQVTSINEKTVIYWKIIGFRKSFRSMESYSYRVIKCSKNGKEYKDLNGFDSIFLDGLPHNNFSRIKEYKILNITEVGTKADIQNGIDLGIKKRRVGYLKSRIKQDQKELLKLVQELV